VPTGWALYAQSESIGLDANYQPNNLCYDDDGYELLAQSYAEKWARFAGLLPPAALRTTLISDTTTAYVDTWYDSTANANTVVLNTNGGDTDGVFSENAIYDTTPAIVRHSKLVTRFNSLSYVTNGLSAYLQIGGGLPSGSFSISVWANMAAGGASPVGLGAPRDEFVFGASTAGIGLLGDVDVSLGCLAGTSAMTATLAAGGVVTRATTKTFGADEWHHYVVVYDDANGLLSVYLDGALETTVPLAPNSNTGIADVPPGVVYVGTDEAGVCSLLAQVDDARVYSAALTATQVGMLYTVTRD